MQRTVFFISDSTGITAETIGNSILAQFEGVQFDKHRLPFTDNAHKAEAAALRALFQLLPSEQAVCLVSIGTVVSRKAVRMRPHPSSYVSTLDAERGVVPEL